MDWRLVVCLPGEDYKRLERWADSEDRTVEHQATRLLRQVLREPGPALAESTAAPARTASGRP